jgi:hypothetical protein
VRDVEAEAQRRPFAVPVMVEPSVTLSRNADPPICADHVSFGATISLASRP